MLAGIIDPLVHLGPMLAGVIYPLSWYVALVVLGLVVGGA